MPRLRAKHLPHLVDVKVLLGETSEGESWSDWIEDVPAYVEQKSKLVVDRRSTSPTAGQEVTSSTFVVVLHDNDLSPRSMVKVWKDTPRERTSEVVTSDYFSYPRAPGHTQAFLD
ncbi:hypothetical protein GCM10022239_03400 [Leifsonia bigeumensis]|uniref:Uncharacterized protein n=1 Tax=Leifsonella bigeumensis TaxID=433643 RepID=A0ABP7F365_9MICO